ncbi:GlxA family transcriptional regulator [Leisingera sp. M658]|uniref:GlxA family transcriptional regulator n=1 Tax=Leisingera sp. M658 TaxID=2867015 RepID=UPI0021A7B945|nr:helix-turn-helix domain-containing protein [Leisingera sp. M658]UWQ75814.1 helix-turn-helix domain-containing protein [Leisingera sp. M658]
MGLQSSISSNHCVIKLDQDRLALTREFDILVLPGVSMLTLGGFLEPLRIVNALTHREAFRWRVLSLEDDTFGCSNGFHIDEDVLLGTEGCQRCSLVVGGELTSSTERQLVINWIRRRKRFGNGIGYIGPCARLFAEAGVLVSEQFVVSQSEKSAFSECYSHLLPHEGLFCRERDVLSCVDGTAALDFAASFIEQDMGRSLALAVLQQCGQSKLRAGSDQPQNVAGDLHESRHKALKTAIRLMSEHIENPLSMEMVAKKAHISRRQMERLFKIHTALTPSKYYQHMRLHHAKSLLRQTDMRVLDIALACGFSNVSTMKVAYRREFGQGFAS